MITLYGSVLAASLVGSLHCAGMCGPLAAVAGGTPSGGMPLVREVAYHTARLVAYATLGAVAGTLGAGLDRAGLSLGLSGVAAVLSGTTMLLWAGALLFDASTISRGSTPRLHALLGRVAHKLVERPPIMRAILLGIGSALLPCGWLYAFALVAAGTGAAGTGATTMVAFWLGTVPALAGVSTVARSLSARLGARLRPVGAVVLAIVGVTTVVGRMSLPHVEAEPPRAGAALASGAAKQAASMATTGLPLPADAPCHGH